MDKNAEPTDIGKDEVECGKVTNDTSKKYRPKRSKPGFHSLMFEETSYYYKDGLQFVYPYIFTFTAHVKKRWLNLTVLDLFRKEFHLETMEYYENAIKNGKIKLNDKEVSADRILSNNDILKTTVHRHEPPVIHQKIEFVKCDDEMVVINKPPSIPVHPCGRYRHNTIVFILGKEYNLHGLHTIHRIDRLTSGILMFAKTAAKSKELESQIHRKKNVEKEYLARVVGKFPDEEIVVDEPILTASHKVGVCEVHSDGKPCVTKFNFLSFNGKSSVVSCKPQTGRMHQIRVHLQWLGYPIVNDPIYNHPTAWSNKGKKHKIDEVIQVLLDTRKDKSYDLHLKTDKVSSHTSEKLNIMEEDCNSSCKRRKINENEDCTKEGTKVPSTDNDTYKPVDDHDVIDDNKPTDAGDSDTAMKEVGCNTATDVSSSDEHVCYTSLDIGEQYVNEDCSDCKRKWKQPLMSELIMYLHSLHYKGPDWEYKTSIPEWAEKDWSDD